MNEKVCICSFSQDELFTYEMHRIRAIDVIFFKTNTTPNKTAKYELAIVACDFDSPPSVENFLDCIRALNCNHLHLFCIGAQRVIHDIISEIATLRIVDSFSIIIKDSSYTLSLVESMVCSFITPLCSKMIQSTAKNYECLSGLLEIIAVENLPEEDVTSFVTSVLCEDANTILSVIGKKYSISIIENIKKSLPTCNIYYSIDTNPNYEMILIIHSLDKNNTSQKNTEFITHNDYNWQRELEAKYKELFGSYDDTND